MNTFTFHRRQSVRIENMVVTPAGIRIGIATVPRMRVDMTADAIKLQAVLLSPRSTEKVRGFLLAVVIGVLLAFGWTA